MSLSVRVFSAMAFAVALLVSRLPLKPEWLLTFDNANFAFALDHFDPGRHMPQPPGYPLFVGLCKLIRFLIADPPTVFFVAGLLGSLIAVLMVARLAEETGGTLAGIAAALLMVVHPAVWAAELMNPVRAFLGAGSAAVALLAWRSMQPGAGSAWMIGAWGALGIAAGFRPDLAALLGPLVLYAGWRRRGALRDWALSFAVFAGVVAAWSAAIAAKVGGFGALLPFLAGYMDEQSDQTSLLFGAALLPAAKMAGRALVWSFAPCLIWVALVPFVSREALRRTWDRFGVFFLIWLAPALFLYTVVHSAEPGHVLPIVTPACCAGGLVIASLVRTPRRLTALAAAVAFSIWMFCFPPNGVMRVSSAKAVQESERNVEGGLSLIRELRTRGPVTVVASPSSAIAWRVLSYYQQSDPVVVLHSDPWPASSGPASYWIVRGGDLAGDGAGRIETADRGKLIWFLQKGAPAPAADGRPLNQRVAGAAFVTDAAPDRTVTLSGYTFVSGNSHSPANRLLTRAAP